MDSLTGALSGRAARLRALTGIDLSQEQVDAATARLEPGVIVAGAGTGKTTVMASRVAWLVATGEVEADQALGLTFTNKAAAQLLSRIRSMLAGVEGLDPDRGDPAVSTYHSFAARLVEEFGLRIGVEPGLRVLASAERHRLAHRVVRDRDRGPVGDARLATVVARVLQLDDALAEHGCDLEALVEEDLALVASLDGQGASQRIAVDMRETALERMDLADLVGRFRRAKDDLGLVDFADQLRLAERIARECAEVPVLMRERYRVVLLDEYQDTSVSQRVLMQHLFGDGHPVTAVGDPCQAIYGWRGASVRNIDAFPEQFPTAEGRPAPRFPLTVNRRSGPWILRAANDVAADLRAEHPGVEPLRAGAGAGPGALRCLLADTVEAEVEWVADRIAEIGGDRGVPWRSIAVLARAAQGLAAIQVALAERGVPAQLVGAAALLDLPEVAEVRSVLEVLDDPAANPSLLRLLAGPRWRIGPRDLAALAAHAGQRARESDVAAGRLDAAGTVAGRLVAAVERVDPVDVPAVADALDDLVRGRTVDGLSDEAARRLREFAREIDVLRRLVGEPLDDLLHRVLSVTGLDVELAASPQAIAARRRDSVTAFLDLAAGFRDLDGPGDLSAFLAYLRDAERWDASPSADLAGDRNAVSLMTVHKSKGLEFPVVVLPFLCQGVFPSGQRRSLWPTSPTALPEALLDEPVGDVEFPGPDGPRAKDHDAYRKAASRADRLEETRLAYVAITRAERLLIASGHRWGATQKKPRDPGPYLEAVRAVCEEGAGTVDGWAPAPAADEPNPVAARSATAYAWPASGDPDAERLRRDAAASVLAAMAEPAPDAGLTAAQALLVAEWDHDIELLLRDLAERRSPAAVEIPRALSASQVLDLLRDPVGFRRRLRRPMPRPPAPAARRGTRLHAWIEAQYGQLSLIGPDDLPGAADEGIASDADLDALREAFSRTDYARREPVAIEEPFAVRIGGQVVRGRIDAVFPVEPVVPGEPGAGRGAAVRYEVVDWKTGRAGSADELQLAIYRIAWAQRCGIDPEQVSAAFLMVRTGEVVRPEGLPDAEGLAALLAAATGG